MMTNPAKGFLRERERERLRVQQRQVLDLFGTTQEALDFTLDTLREYPHQISFPFFLKTIDY
jgi:hypothetical protein